jgi:RNA polymerase primary sigma factor
MLRALPEEETLQMYRREVERFSLLSPVEERQLLHRAREGLAGALDELVQRNLRLVIYVARRYQGMGVPLADLVNEGNIGLIEGARRFDTNRDNSFASYVFYWIRQSIRKAVMDQRSMIRIPVYRQNRMRKALKSERASRIARNGEDPLAGYPESRFRMVPLSAPSVQGDSAGRVVAEAIADERIEDPLERIAREFLRGDVAKALTELPERQATVLRLYYGLAGQRTHTLAEIGGVLGVTKEYVRQIRNAGLRRLRRAGSASALSSYMD